MAEKNTDVHQIVVAGINPHDVASQINEECSPFYDPIGNGGVAQHYMDEDGNLVGGVVDVWTPEHLTPAQEQYLAGNPHVVDVRHVYPK